MMSHESIDYGIEEEIRRLAEIDERERQREIKAEKEQLANEERGFTQG